MRPLRWLLPAVLGVAAPLSAQGTRADSLRADSVARLAAVQVTVTRGDEARRALPWAVGVQTAVDLRRGQATVSVDEALNNIPGVVASNRYIAALDQRISIRGAGSRANFGTRGVKVLLDGVPQSLPDGQSTLTNVELGAVGRVEVLRGAASSLYGNGSGGVISFESDLSAPDRLQQTLRLTGGSYGLSKWQLRTAGRSGRALGMLSVSRTTMDGFRQHSGADIRQVNAAVDVALTPTQTLELRHHQGGTPFALNPGALTRAEWEANPDSAAAVNVVRGASREVLQRQYSVGWRWRDGAGDEARVVGYVVDRTLDNALAAPVPAPAAFPNGLYSQIRRDLLGLRADWRRRLGEGAAAPRLTLGLDAQRVRDLRTNTRATGGRPVAPVDTLLLAQVETTEGVGGFAQLGWTPTPRWTTSAGLRWDRLRFALADRFVADGRDDSGARTMAAWSGHLGASRALGAAHHLYGTLATAFETPTTTELAARVDVLGGFNPSLDPQRIVSAEVGARGTLGRLGYDLAVFRSRTSDAIVQFLETTGRAFFRNAGATRSVGSELGLTLAATPWLTLQAAHTYADYRFADYRVVRGAAVDTLDGNRLAGVPVHFLRLGARARRGGGSLDADWTWSDRVWGDDRNTVPVEGWGAGRLDVRLAHEGRLAGRRVAPFVAVNNALDARYVGSITLNGAGGRVRESAPGRNYHVGLELGWSILK
jgi:iron complex outermembrane recepter protein